MDSEQLAIAGSPIVGRTPAIFRFRVLIFAALYFIGFYAPWQRYLNTGPDSSTWIALSTLVFRTGFLNLGYATVLVTLVAIACGVAGAALRWWATAYLGAGVMSDKSLRADSVVVSGPYRYLRNPLYVGNLFTCAAVAILMPPTGAVVFMVGCLLLTLALVAAEGPHLAQQLGDAYTSYRRQIPGFLPVVRAYVPGGVIVAAKGEPRWAQALAGESFHVGYAVCLAIFAWQYNVDLLIRCVLICFGIALVANGIFSAREMRPAAIPPIV